MPGYVSHTIMARDVYKKLNKKISLDYMLTYSLGGDLCKYAKCRKDSHKIKQDKFIYNMCDYIKKNNLCNDDKVMGVLYGHISHYIMDMIMHPLIRKLDKECISVFINSHTLIEGYIDAYFVRDKYGISIDKYDNKCLFKGNMNKNIYKMINYGYDVTYGCKNVSNFYRFNLFLYSKIRFLYKIFGYKFLRWIVKFDKFMIMNGNVDFLNIDRKLCYKNYLGNRCVSGIDELYDECVKKTLLYIDEVNKYLDVG